MSKPADAPIEDKAKILAAVANVVSMARRPISNTDWVDAQVEQRRKWTVPCQASVPLRYQTNPSTMDGMPLSDASEHPFEDGPGFVLLICDTLEDDQPMTRVFDPPQPHRFQVAWVRTHPGAYLRRAGDMNLSTRVLLTVAVPEAIRACGAVVEAMGGQVRGQLSGWFICETMCVVQVLDRVRQIVLSVSSIEASTVVAVHQICQNRAARHHTQPNNEIQFDCDVGMVDSEEEK